MRDEVFSYVNLGNAALLEDLYQKYLQDPSKIDSSWRGFFAGMEFAKNAEVSDGGGDVRVFRLIEAYKRYGHKNVLINPLQEKKEQISLSLDKFGLSTQDLDRLVPTFGFLKEENVPLKTLVDALEKQYCFRIGYEIGEVTEKIERMSFSKEERLKMLQDLMEAELFETFIHTKYPGQTRFSLEGGETLIPILNFLVEKGSDLGLEEFVIGMPHRGRLNVLANVLQKPYAQIFQEFEDKAFFQGSGDVKYHQGAFSLLKQPSGRVVAVGVSPNPSHLESIDPIIQGQVRAKQDIKKADPLAKKKVAAVLIHGDASLAGQGVVYETLQMSKLLGYETGGTIHIVVNNHIGYTTLPEDSRSTFYCTDIAKAFGFPVFHVSAENVEECVSATILALQIRQSFQVDVFIDLGCYRKYGHNEGDEPSFTQPLEYKKIKTRSSLRVFLEKQLIEEGVLDKEGVIQKEELFKEKLQAILTEVVASSSIEPVLVEKNRSDVFGDVPKISQEVLKIIGERLTFVPSNFSIHPKLKRLLEERRKMLEGDSTPSIDWGMGELIAYGSLLLEGVSIRLSGQDVLRGTFSHRHATLVDQQTAEKYSPLNHISDTQATCFMYNSPLSEFGVMGFDLGYSHEFPQSLVLWEAQFGDFVNGAQVIIDQYLASSDQKWDHRSNLTLLLPHGYEGKGPEHSSARMERFLQLCAEDNLFIANCTTPAQFFHLLRRQAYLKVKRPLVVFTPKLLLRHPSCLSAVSEFIGSVFLECLDDPSLPLQAKRVILCSGKVFYDLLEARALRKSDSIAIIRIEQLYPFPVGKLLNILGRYSLAQDIVWVQEESKNMGAWSYVKGLWQEEFFKNKPLRYIGREESASPASGSYLRHKKQLENFIEQVFLE